ncbi:hypothetical protein [Bifidobacterium canis]|uniref:hypothetical protein n=1 Tax=Bifidobacterium canis TaxID=2610880 RepID=UPI0012D9BBB0|nr:hypothetical protein [Bifidobacterium canis]
MPNRVFAVSTNGFAVITYIAAKTVYKTANPSDKTAKSATFAVLTDGFAVITHNPAEIAYKTAKPVGKTAKDSNRELGRQVDLTAIPAGDALWIRG